jgi:hypothetical protein
MSVSNSTTTRAIVAQLVEDPSFSANCYELSFHLHGISRLGCDVMRWTRVVCVGALALGFAGLGACGGKVVIDADGTSGSAAGGAGGSGGNGGSGGSMSSSSGGNSCVEGTCSGTPDGSCDCSATCTGVDVKATCFSTGGSFSCACTVGGMVVSKCEGVVGSFACDVKVGCCAEFFP